MNRYQLLNPPEEGWRGRMSVIAQILRSVFRPTEQPAPELQPIVERMKEVSAAEARPGSGPEGN